MDKETLEGLGISIDEVKEGIIDRLSDEISNSVGRDIRRDLLSKATGQVDKKLEEIAETVMTQTFQPVTSWGESKGEPTTIRDLIEQGLKSWWEKKVDSSGSPSNYSNSTTRAQYYANNVVGKYVQKELRQEMDKIINDGKAKVREAMSKAVSEQIKRYW